jgi:uncharacterized phage infection (PIP) family protein YhgE
MPVANTSPSNAAVRRQLKGRKRPPDFVSAVAAVAAAGAQSPDVQGSAAGAASLAVLQKALTTAQTGLSTKQAALLMLLAAIKAFKGDIVALQAALSSYEGVVNTLAAGNAAIINKAGLLSRDTKSPATALSPVSTVSSKLGKATMEAIVSWPEAPGATSYAIQVNFTPQTASSAWTALGSGSRRTRVVKTPTAGAQFLVQVAALSSDGTQSAWSASILATAR